MEEWFLKILFTFTIEGIELMALYILGKSPITKLHPWILFLLRLTLFKLPRLTLNSLVSNEN